MSDGNSMLGTHGVSHSFSHISWIDMSAPNVAAAFACSCYVQEIAKIDYLMSHTSLSLKEEKEYMAEIKQLRSSKVHTLDNTIESSVSRPTSSSGVIEPY